MPLPILLLSGTAESSVEEAVATVSENISTTTDSILTSLGLDLGSLALSNVLSAAVILVVCLIFTRLLLRMVNRFLERSKLDKTLHAFIRTGARVLLYILTGIIVVGSMGFDVTSLVAALSVVGLAVSLALQNTLSNVAGGIMILATKPFLVGDYIESGDQSGTVLEIGMSYTRINTIDNKRVSIPNSTISSANIVNYSTEGNRRVVLTFNVAYENDVENVKQALLTAISRCDKVITDEGHEPFARLTAYGDSAITYTLRAWCKNPDYWDVYYFLLEETGRVFAEMGVVVSYNRLNVEIVNADGTQAYPGKG